MAILQAFFTVRLLDAYANDAPYQFYFLADDSKTIADFATDIDTVLTELDLVTDAIIESCELKITLDLPGGLKSVAGPQPLQAGIRANYDIADELNRSWSMTTPALKASWKPGGVINNSGALATYLGYWLVATGPGTTITSLTTNHWSILEAGDYLVLNTRKDRKEQDAVNFLPTE